MRRLLLFSLLGLAVLYLALASGFHLYYRLLYVLALAGGVGLALALLNVAGVSVRVDRPSSRARVGERLVSRIWVRNPLPLPKTWLEVAEETDLPEG